MADEIMARACDAVSAETFVDTLVRYAAMHPSRVVRVWGSRGCGTTLTARTARLSRGSLVPYTLATVVLHSDPDTLPSLLDPPVAATSSTRNAVLRKMRAAIQACASTGEEPWEN
jgi:hypothetical protein